MEDILPKLWVNQSSKFLIAYHEHGLFDHPKVANVRQEVVDWESSNSALLARFHAHVKRIVNVVNKCNCCPRRDKLYYLYLLLIRKHVSIRAVTLLNLKIMERIVRFRGREDILKNAYPNS